MAKKKEVRQIDKIANFIMSEIEGEPSQNEGTGDTAIRIIKQLQAENRRLKEQVEYWQQVYKDRGGEIVDKLHP